MRYLSIVRQGIALFSLGILAANAQASIRYDTTISSDEMRFVTGNTGYETVLPTSGPITLFHPQNVNGFVSYQGVDPLVSNGFGLAVHAQADLVQGHYETKSTGSVLLEFVVRSDDPFASTVPITIRGAYSVLDVDDDSLFGTGASVSAYLERGLFANGGGTTLGSFQAFSAGEDLTGIWEINAMANVGSSHLLRLSASAIAIDTRPNGGDTFIPASRAFIDPVIISSDPSSPITVEFTDPAAFVQNPDFIAPVPEPASLSLLFAIGVAFGLVRRRR